MGSLIDSTIALNGEYEAPSGYFERKFDGEILRVKPWLIPESRLTPEHPVLVCGSDTISDRHGKHLRPNLSPMWKPASDLSMSDWVFFPKPTFSHPRHASPTLLWLIGLWIAEGHIISSGRNNGIVFSLGHHEQTLAFRILELGQRVWNSEGWLSFNPTSLQVCLPGKNLRHFFESNFGRGASSKKLPSWIMEQEDLMPFLLGWIEGDGYRANRTTWTLTTVSKNLAYQAILIGARMGILPSVSKVRQAGESMILGRHVQVHDSWSISFAFRDGIWSRRRGHIADVGNGYWIKIRNLKRERFTGQVSNIETPSGSYLLSFIVHNCAKVPGITPGQVADPRGDLCKPGALEKAVGSGISLVEVRQDGCGACKIMDEEVLPKVEGNKLQITLGTVPACDTVADKLKVSATPTLIFYKSGKEYARMEGVTKAEKDLEQIRKHLGTNN